jgi:hypothetical protein
MVLRVLTSVSLVAMLGAIAVASAMAKGPNIGTVCGATGCITIRGETAVWPLLSWSYAPFSSRTAPAPAPYYSIRLDDPSGIKWVILYVPTRHAVRIWQSRVPPYPEGVGPYWRTLPASADRVFRRAVGRMQPRLAPPAWSGR